MQDLEWSQLFHRYCINNIATLQKCCAPSVESGSTGTFDKLAEQNLIGLKKVLDANDDSGVDAVRKLMDFYQSCMNTEEINALGAEPILAIIKSTGEQIHIFSLKTQHL